VNQSNLLKLIDFTIFADNVFDDSNREFPTVYNASAVPLHVRTVTCMVTVATVATTRSQKSI